jgi:hypothetical protein
MLMTVDVEVVGACVRLKMYSMVRFGYDASTKINHNQLKTEQSRAEQEEKLNNYSG